MFGRWERSLTQRLVNGNGVENQQQAEAWQEALDEEDFIHLQSRMLCLARVTCRCRLHLLSEDSVLTYRARNPRVYRNPSSKPFLPLDI